MPAQDQFSQPKKNKLTSAERQDEILNLLSNQFEVKFGELSEFFGVTEMTVRRDIEKMEQNGQVRRTFGGAISAQVKDLAVKERIALMAEEKIRIGRAAAALIQIHESVFVDAGTTTLQIARHLKPKSVKTVVTNSPHTSLELQERSIPTLVIGGQLLESTISLVGPLAEETLQKMSFDQAFIAATGLTVEGGLSNSNVFELPIKRIAMQNSKKVTILMDSSKFGVKSLAAFAALEEFHRLITDTEPPREIMDICKKNGVEVTIAT